MTADPADLLGPGHLGSHGDGHTRLMTADRSDRPLAAEIAAPLSVVYDLHNDPKAI